MTVVAPSPLPQEDDARGTASALMRRVASGDQHALGELYDLTAGRVFGLLLQLIDDAVLAEATLHEVYLEAWTHAAHFPSTGGSADTWLHGIARRRSLGILPAQAEDGSAGLQ